MNNAPIKQDEAKKPEQTPADLQLNKAKKDAEAGQKSHDQSSSSKEFVNPNDKKAEVSSTPPRQ
jgi:hypothetical protein